MCQRLFTAAPLLTVTDRCRAPSFSFPSCPPLLLLLLSASSDGRVCFWNLSKLDRPESTIELAYEPPLSSPRSPTHASPPLLSSGMVWG